MEKKILLSSPTMHSDEMKFIEEAFEKNWVAPLGFNCTGFEDETRQYLNDDVYCLCLNSGTAALHLSMILSNVKPGDIVLCSDMTFSATVNPVSYQFGKQVFVDSERDSWNMDPQALEKAFEKYPNAKIVDLVHLYGVPAKIDEIKAICKKHNAILIEDAAEAFSSTYKGKKCGTFGEFAALSFNGNKIITTSGGGMLICKSETNCNRALFLATQARENAPWYQHEVIGYNYRMSNIVAGIGRGQLKHLEEHKRLKTEIYKRYKEGLKNIPVSMNPYLDCSEPNFWLSCMLIDKGCKVTFMDVLNHLKENNIETRPIWKPMHLQPVFKDCDFISVEKNPVDEDIFNRGLCLPSDIKMTIEEQDYVIEKIIECFK